MVSDKEMYKGKEGILGVKRILGWFVLMSYGRVEFRLSKMSRINVFFIDCNLGLCFIVIISGLE